MAIFPSEGGVPTSSSTSGVKAASAPRFDPMCDLRPSRSEGPQLVATDEPVSACCRLPNVIVERHHRRFCRVDRGIVRPPFNPFPFARKGTRGGCLEGHLTEDEVEDPTVAEVLNFDRGVDPGHHTELDDFARDPGRSDHQVLAREEGVG